MASGKRTAREAVPKGILDFTGPAACCSRPGSNAPVFAMATRNILITGGSSGIGAALARVYAGAATHLALWGRDAARLEEVARDCRAANASVETTILDVRDIASTVAAVEALDARVPLDIAILNAGLGGTAAPDRHAELPQRAHDIAMVNFASPVVCATVIAERMAARGKGHIVLMGSVAGHFPLPMAPTYAASKAGLALFAEALELRIARHGVSVTLVAPGYIDTPMSRSVTSYKPFLMTADAAARIIMSKIAAGRRRVVVPWRFRLITGASRLVPHAVTRSLLKGRR
jgi:short-subunit dehydrogenase